MASAGVNVPAMIVTGISIVIGLLMVIVFRYTSDQKAIHAAKDQLKAHLLALRLFQDQIPVVMRSYGRIILATGRYLRLAFLPFLVASVPLIFFLAQVDRYLGSAPISRGSTFLVKARVTDAALNDGSLILPDGLTLTAPPVHVPEDKTIVWRVAADRDGEFAVNVQIDDKKSAKSVQVGNGLTRLSGIRMRGKFWERALFSAEPALSDSDSVESIEVLYPPREISFAWIEWNWIWLFFVLSLAAGFLFKSVLGIEI